ncbi:MAG: cell division protein SepF [Clostridia bacterium]|nr:cell division protein SepF [Clostridia bacterium]
MKSSYSDTLEELFNQNANRENETQSNGGGGGGDFTVSFPTSWDDIREIISGLKKGGSALVNLDKEKSLANRQRYLDYLSGATFALGASFRKIQDYQYLITASGVSIKIGK